MTGLKTIVIVSRGMEAAASAALISSRVALTTKPSGKGKVRWPSGENRDLDISECIASRFGQAGLVSLSCISFLSSGQRILILEGE